MTGPDELRRLLAAATPGPWTQHKDYVCAPEATEHDWNVAHFPYNREDAEFVVAAVNALPGLLDELDALQANNDELSEDLVNAVAFMGQHKAERDAALAECDRLRDHEDCDLWAACPCYVEGREQGDEPEGARV